MWFLFVSGQITVTGIFGHGNEASVCIKGEEFRNLLSYNRILKVNFALEVMGCFCCIFSLCLDHVEIYCYLMNQYPHKPLRVATEGAFPSIKKEMEIAIHWTTRCHIRGDRKRERYVCILCVCVCVCVCETGRGDYNTSNSKKQIIVLFTL